MLAFCNVLKIKKKYRDPNLSKSAFARSLGLTPARVSQMIKDGLPVEPSGKINPERGRAWVRVNVDPRRSAMRPGAVVAPAVPSERDRLAREQADAVALKNAKLRGELVSAADVEKRWSDILRRIRSGVLAVPARVRQMNPHLTGRDVAAIDAELRRVLDDLAGAADA
ncbi:MAG: DNA packaging protein [Rhodopseudomonas palustris]|nr:MAG: DNA packaging protein [Rhodopseudomonas palustris]